MDRRRFLQALAAAATVPTMSPRARAADSRIGPLRPDPDQLLDLPDEFTYTVVSRAGDRMSDGLLVPHAHDGMAAFPGPDGHVVLVCNHEITPAYLNRSAFGDDFASQPEDIKRYVYDLGGGNTPGCGGTTTIIYDPATRRTERQFLSLAGTELNCAGGATPWGTWLSCEECFESPGIGWSSGQIVSRDQHHGYVFEVSAYTDGLTEPVPIRAMGKFEHEAAAVHEPSGIVFLTEDRRRSLFYRYIPDLPGSLHAGGKLQALAIDGVPSFATHNWSGTPDIVVGESLATRWIDLDDINPGENDLRLRGASGGAATFARGEGLCAAAGEFVFTCTVGGVERLGQVFSYRPSLFEGQEREQESPGQLTLIAEATRESVLQRADNLTLSPWGDLIVCEDAADNCGLVGIRPDRSQYQLADNPYTDSELAGACFSPDGRTLFVNIQYPGTTLAITGPFPD